VKSEFGNATLKKGTPPNAGQGKQGGWPKEDMLKVKMCKASDGFCVNKFASIPLQLQNHLPSF
jgi:hypothetical protein